MTYEHTVRMEFFCRKCEGSVKRRIIDGTLHQVFCDVCNVAMDRHEIDRMMEDYQIYFAKQTRNEVLKRDAPTVAKMFGRHLLQPTKEPFYPFKAVLE